MVKEAVLIGSAAVVCLCVAQWLNLPHMVIRRGGHDRGFSLRIFEVKRELSVSRRDRCHHNVSQPYRILLGGGPFTFSGSFFGDRGRIAGFIFSQLLC